MYLHIDLQDICQLRWVGWGPENINLCNSVARKVYLQCESVLRQRFYIPSSQNTPLGTMQNSEVLPEYTLACHNPSSRAYAKPTINSNYHNTCVDIFSYYSLAEISWMYIFQVYYDVLVPFPYLISSVLYSAMEKCVLWSKQRFGGSRILHRA